MLCCFMNRECTDDCVACSRLADEEAFRVELIAAIDRITYE